MKFVKTLIMLTTFCAMALGSDARVESLGGNVGFWPGDDQTYTMFPQAVNNLDMIQVSGAGAGSDNGSVGVVWGDATTYGFMFSGDENTMINLLWGNGSMGVNFGLGMANDDNGLSGDDNEATSSMTLEGSFGMNMDFGELGVAFVQDGGDDGDDDTDDQSVMGLGFNLRRSQPVWLFDNMLVGFQNVTITNAGDMTDHNISGMDLTIDLFRNFDMGDGVKGLFAMGFGFSSSSVEMDGETTDGSDITLPNSTVAVEAAVTDWATVRFGCNHSYTLSGSNGDATYMGDASFGWDFGLGFDYGSFNLDMTLDNEGLFNNPVHYVTGRNTAPLSASATLTWSL